MKFLSFILITVSFFLSLFSGSSMAAGPDSFVFVRQSFEGTAPVFIGVKNRKLPLFEIIADGDTVAAEIAKTIGGGISKVSLKLGACAKNFMLAEIKAGRSSQTAEVFCEPLYIHLVRGGNMPKCGFFLKKDGAPADKSFAHYIEMPPDPVAFESIFAHENGHLIDAYIKDTDFEFSADRFVHTAPAISDFWTAFVEGWGEHFETMMVDMSSNPACRNLYTFDDVKGRAYFSQLQDIASLSHKSKRYYWVKSNLFAFKRIPVSAELERLAGDDGLKQYLYNHFNSNFDASELKNIQQMLSTEGLVASLFYRMVNDEKIQSNYLDDIGFYEKFHGGKLNGTPGEIFPPLENAYLKIIAAKYRLFKNYEKCEKMDEAIVFIDFIKQYAALFNGDARDALSGYCMNVYFAGVWEDAAAYYRSNYCASHLTLVDPGAMQAVFGKCFQRIQQTVDKLGTSNVELLAKHASTPLWIINDTFNLGDETEKFFVSININAAEEYELASISFLTKRQAADIVSRRENKGFFASIDDLKKVPSLDEKQIKEFERMRKLFTEKNSRR